MIVSQKENAIGITPSQKSAILSNEPRLIEKKVQKQNLPPLVINTKTNDPCSDDNMSLLSGKEFVKNKKKVGPPLYPPK